MARTEAPAVRPRVGLPLRSGLAALAWRIRCAQARSFATARLGSRVLDIVDGNKNEIAHQIDCGVNRSAVGRGGVGGFVGPGVACATKVAVAG
jgi:hypothetical protein